MPTSTQMWPQRTMNRIIQTLIYRLALHPLISNPPIWSVDGNQIRINKFRNFDGIDPTNTQGVTLSVFPFHYANEDQKFALTVDSPNAGQVFEPYTSSANGADMSGQDKCTANVVVRIDIFGYAQEGHDDNEIVHEQQTIFEFNFAEVLLRQYLDLVASVLRSNDLRTLPRFPDGVPLLSSSFVKRSDYKTSNWEVKGNSILHSADLLWQAEYYVPREWRTNPYWAPVDLVDGNIPVGFIKDAQDVSYHIYYDSIRNLYLMKDGTVVQRQALNDPLTGVPFTTLDADLISLIDGSPKSKLDFSSYFKLVDKTPDL